MSHIVSIQTQIRDKTAVEAACSRLHWPAPVQDRFKLFNTTVEGLGVRAPRWNYPIVCRLDTGELHYDNFEGRWGDPKYLDQLKQAYAIEKTKLEARRQGRSVTETLLQDGSVELVVQVNTSTSYETSGGAL